MKRRAFLELGAGFSLAGLLPVVARADGPAVSAAPPVSALVRPMLLLVDPRNAEGRRRAARATEQGVPTAAVADDVTGFFYEHLHGRWRQTIPVLAGLTTWAPYFCLSQLARDQDMRLVLQEEITGADDEATLYAWVAVPRLPHVPLAA